VLAGRRTALGIDHAADAARRRETRRLPAEARVAAEGENDVALQHRFDTVKAVSELTCLLR